MVKTAQKRKAVGGIPTLQGELVQSAPRGIAGLFCLCQRRGSEIMEAVPIGPKRLFRCSQSKLQTTSRSTAIDSDVSARILMLREDY